jgi:hypothetical protein
MIIIALSFFLIWEVTTRTLVAYLAVVAPDAALRVRSTNPDALLKVAQRELRLARGDRNQSSKAKDSGPDESQETSQNRGGFSLYPTGLTPGMEARIRNSAERALYHDPLNAKALRILGQLSDRTPDRELTRAFMQGAVRRSLHEGIAVYWMMQESYLRQDYPDAIRYADVLLRTRPQLLLQVMPVLGKIAEKRDANDDLKKLLSRNPPWRAAFFAHLPSTITDARVPLDFMLGLEDSEAPPTTAEIASYLTFLVEHRFYQLAYYTWLQFLPPEQLGKAGRLFNGDFELALSGLPFDWILSRGTGSIVKIATRSDAQGGHALFMQFGPGRVKFPGVRQLLLLPPASYELRGTYKVDMLSQLGLQWRITCAGSQTLINEDSELLSEIDPRWKEFRVPFTVPSGCLAQKLHLASSAVSASERFMSGSLWYDDLKIVRIDSRKAPEQPSAPQ